MIEYVICSLLQLPPPTPTPAPISMSDVNYFQCPPLKCQGPPFEKWRGEWAPFSKFLESTLIIVCKKWPICGNAHPLSIFSNLSSTREKYVYLMSRSPLLINSNYYIMDHSYWTPTPSQVNRYVSDPYSITGQ